MNFKFLADTIIETHFSLQRNAVKAINTNLTIRNWLVGLYIVEFEQNGQDRAQYGSKLLLELAKLIGIKGLTAPELSRCRQFYSIYPHILGSLTQEYKNHIPTTIFGSVTQKLQLSKNEELIDIPSHYYPTLIANLSYTHFVELIKIEDPTKRLFYEMSAMKNTMSVRELERCINTLTFERTGLSQNIPLAYSELQSKVNPAKTSEIVKSIYLFDFLELPNQHLVDETELEEALITHLTQFMLELGNGFCFEYRQKRILIDDDYCFIDLVFYHRLLKCHVLVELKIDKFKHEYLSQLNTYVAYYNKKEKQIDDNPTIGILLCADKGREMIEYAMAGITQQLFISKYQLQLPSKQQLMRFIQDELSKF